MEGDLSMGRKLKMEEVAALIGTTRMSIYQWYKFKKENPDNEYSKMLPDYTVGKRNAKLWDEEDLWKLIEFRQTIPHGRNGVLGSVTQRYVKPKTVSEEI